MLGNGPVRFGGRPHGKGPAQRAPRRAAHPVRPDGKRVYVADQYGLGVSVIDVDPRSPTYNTVIRTANVAYLGPNPDIKVSADGTRLYETSDPYGNVVVVNTATMTVVDTIDVSDPYDSYYPEALAFSCLLYTSDAADD